MFKIFKTREFDSDYNQLTSVGKKRVGKLFKKLQEQGDKLGKQLKVPFLREKRINGRRLLYLVYGSYQSILVLTIVSKKMQQRTINKILFDLSEYHDLIVSEITRSN